MAIIEPQRRSGRSGLRMVLWFAVLVLAVVGIALWGGNDRSRPASPSSFGGPFGGQFTLVDRTGRTVTEKSLAGRPYAIFFGFTRCPDVCPTSLARMARLRKQLGADGMKFNIVFVSVDPLHDQPAGIGSYLDLFGTPIIGLTGTDAQIARISTGFGVFVRKVPTEGGDYTIDHTAAIYLMTARGELVGTIDHQEADTVALEKLRRLIG